MASQDTLGDSNETVDADPIGRDDADEIQSEKESVELTDDCEFEAPNNPWEDLEGSILLRRALRATPSLTVLCATPSQ